MVLEFLKSILVKINSINNKVAHVMQICFSLLGKMLIPIMKAEQIMSRRFHQEQDGTIFCSIMWQRQNSMTPKQGARLRIENLATKLVTSKDYTFEENDVTTSYLKLNLEKGDYILRLENISGRGIKAINMVTSMKGA
jgi:hypothetical protein